MTLGETAYRAYCEVRGWKSVNGEALPQFERQKSELKEAWEVAAQAVIYEWMKPPSATDSCRCSCDCKDATPIDPPTNSC